MAKQSTIYVGSVPYTAATPAAAQALAARDYPNGLPPTSTTAPEIRGANGDILNGSASRQYANPPSSSIVTSVTNGKTVGANTGTLNANISTPNNANAKVPAPVVVDSSAAQKDLADKQAEMTQLQSDTDNHQQQVTQAQTTPAAPTTTTTTSGDVAMTTQPSISPYSGDDASGNLNDQIDSLINGLNESDTNIDTSTAAQLTPLQQEQAADQAQYDKQAAVSLAKLSQIASGTYPLSPAEKGLLSATTATFQSTIDAQNQANSAYTGQMAEFLASTGISTSAPTEGISLIHAAISSGEEKVADLQSQMATALSNLQLGFQKQDYDMVSDAWKQTSDYLTQRMTALSDMQKQVTDAAAQQKQDAKDYTQMALSAVVQSADFSQKEKQDAITNAFTQQQLSETQRHNLQTEAVAWENANNSGSGNFTSTQLNKGAENAGMAISDFKALDPDVQNYFVNNASTITSEQKAIADGTKTAQEVADDIRDSNLSDPIKNQLYKRFGASPDSNDDSNGGILSGVEKYGGDAVNFAKTLLGF